MKISIKSEKKVSVRNFRKTCSFMKNLRNPENVRIYGKMKNFEEMCHGLSTPLFILWKNDKTLKIIKTVLLYRKITFLSKCEECKKNKHILMKRRKFRWNEKNKRIENFKRKCTFMIIIRFPEKAKYLWKKKFWSNMKIWWISSCLLEENLFLWRIT